MSRLLCYDRILPRDLVKPRTAVPSGRRHIARAIALRDRKWPNGSTITVGFMGGDSLQQSFVREHAPAWAEHANLKLDFTTSRSAHVRVAFDESDGSWSYIGIDCLEIPFEAPTLNLGWLDEAVVLHEFGHAIGLAHEHQNPDGGIQWNEAAVIADLSGPPNYWDEATIWHNVLVKYRDDQVNGTAFDPRSIMLYAFPGSWVKSGVGTDFNTELSETDKRFVGSEVMYPKAKIEELPELPIFKAHRAGIAVPAERDTYRFTVLVAGDYVIETSGVSDTYLHLYGPNDLTRLVAQNDDSGRRNNARLAVTLQPGVYYVQVRHYSALTVGPYSIWIVAG